MTAIERAEALLVATEAERASDLPPLCVDILRGYIGAVEVLECSEADEDSDPRCYCGPDEEDWDGSEEPIWIECFPCLRQKAFADFERLFPETTLGIPL